MTTQAIPHAKRRTPFSVRLPQVVTLLLLIALLVLMVAPLFLVALNSFKTEAEYVQNGPMALPENFTLENIIATWQKVDYTTTTMHPRWRRFQPRPLASATPL